MNKRKIGKKYEEAAARFLRDRGCIILERNYQCMFGEIDIIALDAESLIFAEVKYRRTPGSGYPEESVNSKKQRRICLTADYYRIENSISEKTSCRFDVLAIDDEEIRYYKNAFMYCGGLY